MRSIREALASHREEIVDQWLTAAHRQAAARGLTAPELRNVMPLYLRALAEHGTATPEVQERLETHVGSRLRQGFDLSEMVEEFLLLEHVIDGVLAVLPVEQRPDDADRHRLTSELHRAIREVHRLFQEHMALDEQSEKRFLRELRTLADASLRDPQSGFEVFLRSVADLIREALAADSAVLLVFDLHDRKLLTHAAVGHAKETLGDWAAAVVPGALGGLLSAAPTQLTDVETTPLAVDDRMRDGGIQALLAMRLPPRRHLLGVLVAGLRQPRPFSAREIRRLQTLGESLALHLESAQLYVELRQHSEALSVERALRERFVAVLAHDLRGPLSVAKLSAQRVQMHSERSHEVKRLAQRIETSVDRLDGMIRDLLDAGRVRAGENLSLHFMPADAAALVRDVSEELEHLHGPRFDCEAPDSLPGRWDAGAIRRALWNLGTNAVKYGQEGGRIRLKAVAAPPGVRLSVHNEGPPIPPEQLSKLFDLYARGKPDQRSAGWGLGLTLVKGCADAHGGFVQVESSQSEGTTFTLALPLEPAANP